VHTDVRWFTLSNRRTPTTMVEQLEHQIITPPIMPTTCLSIDQWVALSECFVRFSWSNLIAKQRLLPLTEIRPLRCWRWSLDILNDAINNTPIFKSLELGIFAPEVTELFCRLAWGIGEEDWGYAHLSIHVTEVVWWVAYEYVRTTFTMNIQETGCRMIVVLRGSFDVDS
jgi:hypothetical protein